MTFNIDWELDESDTVSANSLLGNITLSDGVRFVEEKSVYLDSWLEALLKAAQLNITSSADATISVAEAPRPLHLFRNDDKLHIVTTSGREVVADSPDSFRNAVRGASARFLSRTSVLEDAPENDTLRSIRTLLEELEGPLQKC
jgi:hypothetical protein